MNHTPPRNGQVAALAGEVCDALNALHYFTRRLQGSYRTAGELFLSPEMLDRGEIIKDGKHLRELAIATLGAIAALRDAVPEEVSHAA